MQQRPFQWRMGPRINNKRPHDPTHGVEFCIHRQPRDDTRAHCSIEAAQTENDEPQPQVVVAFGFLITNCAPFRSSL
ncbi:MAG: hypothetical protein E5299_01364 [Burkholderia gladioli]|nr:MAG: hypothetical protein E5299_01364 [Burkholderia gladioli]